MEWIKLFQIQIKNKRKFLFASFWIIILAFSSLILINTFSSKTDISKLLDQEYLIGSLRMIFIEQKGKSYWAPEPILVVLFILLLSVIAIFISELLSYTIRHLQSNGSWDMNKDFNFECFNDLEIQGRILKRELSVGKKKQQGFQLTNSGSGILLKTNYWKNFIIEFEFNFEGLKSGWEQEWVEISGKAVPLTHKPKNNYFGLLFRAQDLNNYFMVSIGVKDILPTSLKECNILHIPYRRKVLITPHVKINGMWEVFSPIELSAKKIKIEKFNHLKCDVKENVLTLCIGDNDNGIEDFQWILPSKFNANWKGSSLETEKKKDEHIFNDSTSIFFRNSCGMIGFRTYGDEHVLIKDLIITKSSFC